MSDTDTDTDASAAALRFDASFPCDRRFAPVLSDLSVKVAQSMGYPEGEAREIGRQIDQAFEAAAAGGGGQGDVLVSVTLREGHGALDATVRCSQRTLLELTRPRS